MCQNKNLWLKNHYCITRFAMMKSLKKNTCVRSQRYLITKNMQQYQHMNIINTTMKDKSSTALQDKN